VSYAEEERRAADPKATRPSGAPFLSPAARKAEPPGSTRRAPVPATDPPDALSHEIEGLRYSLDRPPSGEQRRVVVRVQLADGEDVPLVDRVDLFSFKARLAFAGLVADTFGRQRSEVLGHLAVLLDALERAQDAPAPSEPPLSDARRVAAQALLGRPDLLDRAAHTMSALGYVGEDLAKRLVFLVAVSRLLTRPLSAILLAPSSSGKSELQGALCRLLPPSAFEFLSRITPSALYYAGPDHLLASRSPDSSSRACMPQAWALPSPRPPRECPGVPGSGRWPAL